jgi:hypothetical protein
LQKLVEKRQKRAVTIRIAVNPGEFPDGMSLRKKGDFDMHGNGNIVENILSFVVQDRPECIFTNISPHPFR